MRRLAHYQLAEKRHARWVMLQKLIYRTELALRRLMRFLRRVSLLAFRLARRVASFTARTTVFVYTSVRDAVIACFDWLRARALAFARLSRRWLASSVWLAAQARALAALRALVFRRMGVDARACRDRVVLDSSIVARDCRRSALLARENRETRESPCPHSLAKFALHRKRRLGLDGGYRAGRRRQSPADAAAFEMDRRQWPHSRARLSEMRRAAGAAHLRRRRPRLGKRIERGGLVRREGQSSSTRNSRKCAPSIDLGRGSPRAAAASMKRNVSSGTAWSTAKPAAAQASAENARRVSIWGATHSRAAASSIGRNVSSGAAWSADGKRGASSIAASRSSYSWALLRMRASNATFGATAPGIAHTGRALVVRQHGAHLFRAEAARFPVASPELDPPLLAQLECGPRISLIAA